MAEHGGTGSRYEQGCRCDVCTDAHRTRVRKRRYARMENREVVDGRLVAVDAPSHGKASTYKNWGCRCAPCTDAHTVMCGTYFRARRACRS